MTADAQTLILDDVQNGQTVITPNQMVTVNGITTVGWWETDPNTGHTISHFVNGGHQAIAEYAAVQVADFVGLNPSTIKFIGQMEGFALVGIDYAASVLELAASPVKTAKSDSAGEGEDPARRVPEDLPNIARHYQSHHRHGDP